MNAVTLRIGKNEELWYAIKVIDKEKVVDSHRVQEVFRERNLLAMLRHDRICNSYFAFQDKKRLYLIMDLALGGDLRYQLHNTKDGKPFPEEQARFYTAQLVAALEYIHSRRVIHRDIKPENILLDSRGYIKLTDFGIAGILDERGFCTMRSGTRGYAAPEIYRRGHLHCPAADFFAVGVTVYEFVTGARPYSEDEIKQCNAKMTAAKQAEISSSSSMEVVKEGEVGLPVVDSLKGIDRMSKGLVQFLRDTLTPNQKKRIGFKPNAPSAKNHLWFTRKTTKMKDFDWDAVESGTEEAPFLPDITKMNADPQKDIQEFFSGNEELKRLREPTPEENKQFDAYDFDYRKHEKNLLQASDFDFSGRLEEDNQLLGDDPGEDYSDDGLDDTGREGKR